MQSKDRWNDVRVGAFVALALGILVVGSLWIAGSSLFRPRGRPYTVRMTDSAGLRAGDRVRIAGVQVGRIRSVELQAGEELPVTMVVDIRADVAVHTDGSAGISQEGMLGLPFLQIDPGSPDQPLLPPGGKIDGSGGSGINEALAEVGALSAQAQELFGEATTLLRTLSTEIKPVLDGLERMLSKENTDNMATLIETMNRTLADVGPRAGELLERLDTLATTAENGLQGLPEVTDQVALLVAELRTALGPDGERVTRLLDTAVRSLDSADTALSSVAGNRHEIEATLADLRELTTNLKEFAQLLNERPYSLIRMKMPPDRKPGDGVGGSR